MRPRAILVLALVPFLFTRYDDVVTALILSIVLFSLYEHSLRK